jgi:hypothetical protein
MTLAVSPGSAIASPPAGENDAPSAPPTTARGVIDRSIAEDSPPSAGTPAPPELAEPPAVPPPGRAPAPPPVPDDRIPVDPVAPPSPRPDGRVPIDPPLPERLDDRVPVDPPAVPPPADGAGEPAAPPDPALPPVPALPPDAAPPAVPAAEAPTDSLRRLAESMDVAHNSLTVQISFPPMAGITQTEISIGFSGPRTTQDYNPQFGFRYVYSYPLTDAGGVQRAHFSVTLTEKVTGERFAIDTHRDLEPVFDVTLGTLVLSQTGDCDLGEFLGTEAEPRVSWADPLGTVHEDHDPRSLGGHRHEIRGFAGTYRGIRLAPSFTLPGIEWWESDVTPGVTFHGYGASRGGPLLPGASRTISETKAELGDGPFGSDCSGLFTYDLTYTPWTWASLNPHIRTPR